VTCMQQSPSYLPYGAAQPDQHDIAQTVGEGGRLVSDGSVVPPYAGGVLDFQPTEGTIRTEDGHGMYSEPSPAVGHPPSADDRSEFGVVGKSGETHVASGRIGPPSRWTDARMFRLTIHSVEGRLSSASMVAPFVRMHVVDNRDGIWWPRKAGELCCPVFNLDVQDIPYLRGLTKKRTEPWHNDIGQFGEQNLRPFTTLPCKHRMEKNRTKRLPPSWNESFLLAESLGPDSLLLFEVVCDRQLERGENHGRSRPLKGHAPELNFAGGVEEDNLAWCFLDIGSVLAARGRSQAGSSASRSPGVQPRRLRLQLYQYCQDSSIGRRTRQSLDFSKDEAENVFVPPDVYCEYSRAQHPKAFLPAALNALLGKLGAPTRQEWPALLEVSFEPMVSGVDLNAVSERARKEFNAARGLAVPAAHDPGISSMGVSAEDSALNASEESVSVLAPHARVKDQPSALPDTLLMQLVAGDRGSFRMSLSPSGQLLAAAVAHDGGIFELRIFNLASGRVHAVCGSRHDAYVYDLCWYSCGRQGPSTSTSVFLMSCSGDGVVQIFEVPECQAALAVPLRLYARLHLPSHVYSVRPHPGLATDPQQMVLACGGHGFGLVLCKIVREYHRIDNEDVGRWTVRLPHWQEQVKREGPNQQADILCVRFSSQKTTPENLYASDSVGRVMLYQVRIDATLEGSRGGVRANFVRFYSSPDIDGIPIYSLDVVTSQLLAGKRRNHVALSSVDDWLLLYARDHLIRLVSLQRGSVKVEVEMSGLECRNYPVRGSMSPEGAYVACGSETGELRIWNTSDGKMLAPGSTPQVQLAGPITDTVWSERHHVLVCCALDDEAPPILVFAGVGVEDVPVAEPATTRNIELAFEESSPTDVRPPSLLALTDASGGDWANRWLNDPGHIGSVFSRDHKRQLKEKILSQLPQLQDRKAAVELEQHFAATQPRGVASGTSGTAGLLGGVP